MEMLESNDAEPDAVLVVEIVLVHSDKLSCWRAEVIFWMSELSSEIDNEANFVAISSMVSLVLERSLRTEVMVSMVVDIVKYL